MGWWGGLVEWLGVGWLRWWAGSVWTQTVKATVVQCLGKTPFGKAKSIIVLVLFMGGLFIQEPLFDC